MFSPRTIEPDIPVCGSTLRPVTSTDITNFVIDLVVTRRLSTEGAERQLPLPQAVFHILVALADQDRHGYAIMQHVVTRTNGALKLSPGTLYGSIKRMLADGLIVEVETRPAPKDDERRRYYRMTRFGHEVAQAEANRLTTLLRQAYAAGLTSKRAW